MSSKIIIGSARIDENGNLSGGKAGDQTTKEVSTQEFYVHKKGWYIYRPKSPKVAVNIALNMQRACANDNIGYDQGNRLSIISKGIDTKEPAECDCASLLRQCIREAANIDPGNFTTATLGLCLDATKIFEQKIEYKDGVELYTGDVLVTKTKGHTVVVVQGKARVDTLVIKGLKKEQSEFLSRIVPMVIRQNAKHDFALYSSVTIAQAIHESGWGKSRKMIAANALFGVKVGSGKKYGSAWHGAAYKTGTTEYYDGKTATRITDYFRQYDSIEDSICDYMDLLVHNDRYRRALFRQSPEESIEGIVSGGYATGPNYSSAIEKIINLYDLRRYDAVMPEKEVCPYTPIRKYTLRKGQRGEIIKALQWYLNKHLDTAPLTIDGAFGPRTERAVLEFQHRNGLDVDGLVGPRTWEALTR